MAETKMKTDIPAGAKRPNDRKPKATDSDVEHTFTFERDGETYTSRNLMDVLTPRFIRVNRSQDEMSFQFTLFEALFEGNDAAMAAVDAMDWKDFAKLSKELDEAMKEKIDLSVGE